MVNNMSSCIKKPEVSVYISTFNRLERLKRAVSSVLNQDLDDIEILICDDASTDGTKDYVYSLIQSDSRVRYFRNEENKGACATRNLGILAAKGKFITGLDDDDEFSPDRLSVFVNRWSDNYSFLCSNFINVYSSGVSNKQYKDYDGEVVFSYKDMLFDNVASNQVFTLTRNLQDINGFDVRVKKFQDWDTWLRLSYEKGCFLRLPECTYIMNHDHSKDELRVSKNETEALALTSLLERNRDVYGLFGYVYMKSLVRIISGNVGFFIRLRWFFVRKIYDLLRSFS